MKQILCLSIAAVLLFGASVVHGQAVATLGNINCASVQAISFDITIPDIGEWTTGNAADELAWALNAVDDAACKPSFDQGNNKVVYAAFDVAVCGQSASSPAISFDKVIYQFDINVVSDDSPVTYQYDHQYTIRCSYDKEQNVQASFQPLHSLTDDGSAGGNLVIDMTLHNTDNSPLAGVIDLGTAFYVQVLLENDAAFPDLDVHLLSVTASPDVGGVVTPVTLITNGCEEQTGIVDADSLTCDADANERFDLTANGAFRFSGQTGSDLVYFHATVTVCLSSNAGSTCQVQCAATCPAVRRKRRETVQDALQTTYYVSAGPYRIVDPESNKEAAVDKNVKDEGSAFPTYAIAVVAVCGVVAIAIASAVVVIVLRRRRQNTTISEPRDTGVTA